MDSQSFAVDDLLLYKTIRDIHVAPDGSEVAFERKDIDRENDTYRSSIWVVPTSGGDPKQLTNGQSRDSKPRWSPKGDRLAFVSTRGKNGPQAYVIDRHGGEARLVTAWSHPVSTMEWSPDGRFLLLTAPVPVEEKGATKTSGPQPKVVTEQRYKSDGTGFMLRSHTHAFIVEVDSTDDPIAVTSGPCDVGSAAWSPDGKRIVITRAREHERHITDIWTVATDGTDLRQLSSTVASATTPTWSPDGKWIAFFGAEEPGDSRMLLWLADARGGEVRQLGGDRCEVGSFPLAAVTLPMWSADSTRVAFLFSRDGLCELAAVSIENDELTRLVTGDQQIIAAHAADRFIAYTSMSIDDTGDVCLATWEPGDGHHLTDVNGDWWKTRARPTVERHTFTHDGQTFDGWLIWPPGVPVDQQVPRVLIDVHGGPHSYTEFGFPYHPYWYVLGAKGWAILALNTTGSSSYGEAFASALRGHWGELDWPQHLAALDQLQAAGRIGRCAAVAGKSYGGYMAAWAIGHTDRLSAAIVSAPVTNLESHAGTSDSGYYVGPFDMEGELHERRERFRRLSPIECTHLSTTPTLILQGENDERCPKGQSEELFASLKRAAKAPVEMVLYPEGGHSLAENGRPSHRVDYHSRLVDWLERWCVPTPSQNQ